MFAPMKKEQQHRDSSPKKSEKPLFNVRGANRQLIHKLYAHKALILLFAQLQTEIRAKHRIALKIESLAFIFDSVLAAARRLLLLQSNIWMAVMS